VARVDATLTTVRVFVITIAAWTADVAMNDSLQSLAKRGPADGGDCKTAPACGQKFSAYQQVCHLQYGPVDLLEASCIIGAGQLSCSKGPSLFDMIRT
jgi:hypothetical protein